MSQRVLLFFLHCLCPNLSVEWKKESQSLVRLRPLPAFFFFMPLLNYRAFLKWAGSPEKGAKDILVEVSCIVNAFMSRWWNDDKSLLLLRDIGAILPLEVLHMVGGNVDSKEIQPKFILCLSQNMWLTWRSSANKINTYRKNPVSGHELSTLAEKRSSVLK